MPIETFAALADDLASMGSVEAVILAGMGDPFVHPHIDKAIGIAKHKGWHVTVLTNALLADPERLLALDLDMMLISVNGVSLESYVVARACRRCMQSSSVLRKQRTKHEHTADQA